MINLKQILSRTQYIIFSALFFILPSQTHAGVTLPDSLRPSTLPTKKILTLTQDVKIESQVQSIVGDILTSAMYLTGGVAVVMIIVAGIRYAISGGDDTQTGEAKNTIKWVIFGLLILFTSLSIIRFVVQITVGVSEF